MRDPGYVGLFESGELHDRNRALQSMYSACRLCPAKCNVDRGRGELGACGMGIRPSLPSYCLHFGEEPALVNKTGVGNLFFGGCNLRCIYCQNWEISQVDRGQVREVDEKTVSDALIDLQNEKASLLGFVSPTHNCPAITGALLHAIPAGLNLPLIYNSNGYDSVEALRLLEGVTEIYLPDLRYADDEMAEKYSGVRDYVNSARRAILEMHRQTGSRLLVEDGTVRRGLIIRLLVLPGNISGTLESLRWIRDELGTQVTLSLMSQYYPAHLAMAFPPLDSTLDLSEYRRVVTEMEKLGFESGWVQGEGSDKTYRPDFADGRRPFHS